MTASIKELDAQSHSEHATVLPSVSIGVPVYNGSQTLRKALESILAQSYPNIEVLISDNCSDDSTQAICRAMAALDDRIVYYRQEQNIGAPANFKFVLDQAGGQYFMWAAADDVRSPDFLLSNVEFLEAHPDYVASTSPVRFEDGDFDEIKMGDGSLEGDLQDRFQKFFGKWHANGRFYSLMRREAIKSCAFVDASFLGSDWAVVVHLMRQGKLRRLQDGWTVLGAKGVSRGKDIFKIYRNGLFEFLLPFAHLSRLAWESGRSLSLIARASLGVSLLRLNAMAFLAQFLARWR